jgi:tRNA (cytidine/uridine-2'-O-)-methyltransferase
MISIALYKPDIPQNTAAILRLSACLKIKVHIIEPCAFNLADPRFIKSYANHYLSILCVILTLEKY